MRLGWALNLGQWASDTTAHRGEYSDNLTVYVSISTILCDDCTL